MRTYERPEMINNMSEKKEPAIGRRGEDDQCMKGGRA